MQDDFYRQLEERFRGSRESIKERLTVYRPLLGTLREHLPAHRAMDLGCGRGEWLELLVEAGFDARGVDQDAHMLQACRERHLAVEQADALQALRAMPDNHLALISAIHVVEHLPLETLIECVKEAHRTLLPGGLLIMETPNPENVYAGLVFFHMDPTHVKPLPPELLAFFAEYGGFGRHAVLRLDQSPGAVDPKHVTLRDVVFHTSQDYAVVAQKAATPDIHLAFDALFHKPYGISLPDMIQRYDERQNRHMSAALHGAAIAEDMHPAFIELQHVVAGLDERLRHVNAGVEHQTERLNRLTAPIKRLLRPWFALRSMAKRLLGR